MKLRNKTWPLSALCLGCLGLTLAATVRAADEPSPTPPETGATAPAAGASGLAGQRVVRDPATGRLREPEGDEMQGAPAKDRSASSAAQQRRAKTMQRFRDLTAVTGAKGAAGYRLDASHMSFSVARRQLDGSLAQDCVTGERAATELMSTPATSAVANAVSTEAKEHDHAR